MNKKIIIIFLFFLLLLCCHNDIFEKEPTAYNGFIDLKNWDINDKGPVKLNGEWEFYWNKLYTPYDFKSKKKPEITGYAYVPKKWNNINIENTKINNKGYATYRLRIRLDAKGKILALRTKSIFSAYRLWINDKLVSYKGVVGKSKKSSIPEEAPMFTSFYPESNDIEIIIQVSNYHDGLFSGLVYPVLFGTPDQILKENKKSENKNIFLYGLIIMAALYNLGIFLLRRSDKAPLFFSIFCFIISIRCFIETDIYYNFFNEILFYLIQKKMEYLTVPTAVIGFNVFIYSLYKTEYNKYIFWGFFSLSILYSLIIIFSPVYFFTNIMPYYHIILIQTVAYVIYVIILTVIRKREGSVLFIAGLIIFIYSILSEIIYIFYQVKIGFFTPTGTFIFILAQSFILSLKYSNSVKKTELYSKQLEDYSRRLEEKVKERTKQLEKATNEKTNLFINIAHETKTPLTLVSNYLDKFMVSYGKSEELNIIKENLDKLKRNMIDFLDMEKLERGKIFYNHNQIINISKLIYEKILLFKELANKKQIKIKSDITDNLYTKIDPYAIDRVINNLLDNSIKYTENNGIINIILNEDKNHINLIVEDNGIGMNENTIKHIFEPYYQASHKKSNIQGIGMGLNIVKKIIDSVKGTIEVISKEKEGTKFKINILKHILKNNDEISDNIELSIPDSTIKNINLKNETYKKGRSNILIVEDNIELLAYLQECMNEKYNVFIAQNGQEALNKLDIIPKPHIIISDIMMDIMDGYKFYDELTKNGNYNGIPFIFLTAKVSKNEKIKALTKGAIDFITKPFLVNELIAKIDSILKTNKAMKKNNIYKLRSRILDKLKENITKNEEMIIKKNCRSYNISSREKEVIIQLMEGKEIKEIGDILNISINTVKNHMKNIYKKCNVQNKVELINKIKNQN